MRVFTVLFTFIAFVISPAVSAQSGNVGDILGGIFGGQKQAPMPYFPQGNIDNIPVSVFNEDGRDLGAHVLIVTAYASSETNTPNAKAQFLGETRILLTGLGDPLQVVVGAPALVTRDIEAARLSARVIDENGDTVLISRDDAYFRGQSAPELVLISTAKTSPAAKNMATHTLTGKAELPGNSAPLPRGGKLHVMLREAEAPNAVIAETEINIDQSSSPFEFSLSHPDLSTRTGTKYIIGASIMDWAGRTSHNTVLDEPYIGSAPIYHLKLEDNAEVAGSPLLEDAKRVNPTRLQGEAIFDAYKGLPAGSKIDVILRHSEAPHQTLSQQTIALGEPMGPVKFDLPLTGQEFANGQPIPLIEISITDANNRTLFAAPLSIADNKYMSIRLRSDPRY